MSWDEALDRIAEAFRTAQKNHGRDAVGVFGSGSLTNEKAYLLGNFARVALGTMHIDYNGRFYMSSAASASIAALGIVADYLSQANLRQKGNCLMFSIMICSISGLVSGD